MTRLSSKNGPGRTFLSCTRDHIRPLRLKPLAARTRRARLHPTLAMGILTNDDGQRKDFLLSESDSLRLFEQRYHFRAGFQPVQTIRPSLHHLAPLRWVLGKVVGCAHRVALGVGELALDDSPSTGSPRQARRRRERRAPFDSGFWPACAEPGRSAMSERFVRVEWWFHPCSCSSVDAMLRKPWPVISSFVYPIRRKAAKTALLLIGRSGVLALRRQRKNFA